MKVINVIVVCLCLQAASQGAEPSARPLHPDALYISTAKDIRFRYNSFVIQKKAGKMRFESIAEMGDAPDIQLRFEHEEQEIRSTITIYPAPENTIGPKVILDARGKPIVLEKKKNPYGVFQLSEPSDSFIKAFRNTIKNVEQISRMQFSNRDGQPARELAVPTDKRNSPVAYVAHFEGNGAFRGPKYKNTPWQWEFRLYVVGKYFVKIHTDGPANLDTMVAGVRVANAIGWLGNTGQKGVEPSEDKPGP
jgi:hypothetical protein